MVRIPSCGALAALVLAASSAVGCSSSYDLGATSDELTDTAGAGVRLTEAQVETLLLQAGFVGATVPKMVCVAKYSSGLDPFAAKRKTDGSWNLGLFQINTVHAGNTPACPQAAAGLYELAPNTRCARAVYEMYGLKGWPAYAENRAECDAYRIDRSGAAAGATTPTPTPAPSGTTPVFR